MDAEVKNFLHSVRHSLKSLTLQHVFQTVQLYHSESSTAFLQRNEFRDKQVIFQAGHISGHLQISLYILV